MSNTSPAAVRRLLVLLLAAVVVAFIPGDSAAAVDDGGPVVEILQLHGPLTPPVMRTLHRTIADAERRGSEVLVVELDAPGAIKVSPEELIAPVVSSRVPIVVWVGPAWASASGSAAFLVTSADLAAAARGAVVGPACPARVDRDCAPAEESLLIGAEGEVLLERGMTGESLQQAGVVTLLAEGLEPLLVELDGREVTTVAGPTTLRVRPEEVTIRFVNLGLVARVLDAVLDPRLAYLLFVSVLLLFGFELFQPGFGVAGVTGLILAPLAVYAVVVLPVTWWALLLLVAGAALLAVDLAIAGLGIPSVGGAAALTAGSVWLYSSDHPVMALSGWVIGIVVAFCVVFFVAIMTIVLRAQAGPGLGEVGDELVGKIGVVRSAMNPEGHVFVAGALWRARWVGEREGRIRAGTTVSVVGVEDSTLLVDSSPVPASPEPHS